MASAKDYERQVTQILGVKPDRRGMVKLRFEWDTIQEAKQLLSEVRQMQKRLRLVKKDINADIKSIRARYSSKIHSATPDLGDKLLFGKGKAKSRAAAKKRSIRASKDREVKPYENVKRSIDQALIELDALKLNVTTWIDQNK